MTDPALMSILRRKVKLRQPYAGLFLKKDDNDQSDNVNSLSDIYSVGTFCQIQEFQDLGDKLRMIVIAHRRIRITNQLYEDLEAPKKKEFKLNILNQEVKFSLEHEDGDFESDAGRRRNRRNRLGIEKNVGEPNSNAGELKPRVLADGEQQSVLMVEVENVKKEEYQQTDEIKALTQEVIKTLRDIISMNSLYRDNLQHMISQNQRVVNNPIYLCDLGASLAAAEPNELQDVLQEEDVSIEIF